MKKKQLFGSSPVWQDVISGFVATVLGILVTIGVARCQEERETEKNKRDLTIMIIHDLDDTEAEIKSQMADLRVVYDQAEYVQMHLEEIDSIPLDTVQGAWNIVLLSFEQSAIEFPQMAENIMKGNIETWSTLSNVKFMSNVEQCYSWRKKYNGFVIPAEIYDKASDKSDEIHELVMKDAGSKKPEQIERERVSLLYATEEMEEYLRYFKWVLDNRDNILLAINQNNAQNKWLMSVNDDELQSYIESTSKRAPGNRPEVTKEALVGKWELDREIQRGMHRNRKYTEYTLNADYSMMAINRIDGTYSSNDTVFTHTVTCYGHWKLTDADITLTYDSVRVRPSEAYKDKVKKEEITQLQEEMENGLAPTIFSDILVGKNEFSTMKYEEEDKNTQTLIHFIRISKE